MGSFAEKGLISCLLPPTGAATSQRGPPRGGGQTGLPKTPHSRFLMVVKKWVINGPKMTVLRPLFDRKVTCFLTPSEKTVLQKSGTKQTSDTRNGDVKKCQKVNKK